MDGHKIDSTNMDKLALATCYRLIGELLLYPPDRDQALISQSLDASSGISSDILATIEQFLARAESGSLDEYLDTIEITAACPLYLGSYLFEEPKSCREMGMSGRNSYMIELVNAYAHFGLELNGRELADFIPVILEFLAMSLERNDLDRIGLRRRIVEAQILPGLDPVIARFEEHDSAYALLIRALATALHEDARTMEDEPLWVPPQSPKGPLTATMPEEVGL